MHRTIIKQGIGGNTIFLPIKWVRAHHLQPGDTIEVVEHQNKIVISSTNKNTKLSKEVKVSGGNSDEIRNIIASLYKRGYDEIILNTEKQIALPELNKIISTFTGLEFTFRDKHKIRIQSFLQEKEEEIERLIVKMFHILNYIHTEIEGKWTGVDLLEIETLVRRENRKIRDHCLRTITKTKFGDDKMYDYYDFVTQLEKYGTLLLYLARYIVDEKAKKGVMYNSIKSNFTVLSDCYLTEDFGGLTILSVRLRQDTISPFRIQNLKKLARKESPLTLVYYHNLMFTLRHLTSRAVSLSV